MRHYRWALGLTALFLAVGCDHFSWLKPKPPEGIRTASANPTPEQLIVALNQNARLLQSLECRDVDLDVSQGLQSVSLQSKMICQKPRNFRMIATVAGNTMADIGSNDQEFWFWISKSQQPYLFHCSHQDFASGRARVTFPFQPDWVMEALGMAEYDPAKPYQLVADRGTLQLVEQTKAPDGQPVRKVTVLKATQYQHYQVIAHRLLDLRGREICTANVLELQKDQATGAILPRRIQLSWPAQRMRMTMKLDRVVVNGQIPPERLALVFTRPTLPSVATYDLARGPDVPAGQALQQTGAQYPSFPYRR